MGPLQHRWQQFPGKVDAAVAVEGAVVASVEGPNCAGADDSSSPFGRSAPSGCSRGDPCDLVVSSGSGESELETAEAAFGEIPAAAIAEFVRSSPQYPPCAVTLEGDCPPW